MRFVFFIIIIVTMTSFSSSLRTNNSRLCSFTSEQNDSSPFDPCDYIKFYKKFGNTIADTVRIGRFLVDPIDDSVHYTTTSFEFYRKGNEIYKKSSAAIFCNGNLIRVKYYQNFSERIDLESYREYNDIYFATKGYVYFWYINSGGHLMIPVDDADPKTFEPFENICGGVDEKGVYYGGPNRGVYRLDIPRTSSFEFIPKENNFWNSPNHYVLVDDSLYDIKYDLDRGYFIELIENKSANEILKKKK